MAIMKNKRILLAILLSILFIILSILVALDKTVAFDNYVYHLVTIKMSDFLTNLNHFFTFLGSTIFIVFLSIVLVIFFFIKKKKNCSFIIALVIILSTIVNNVVKIIIRRKRPTVLALVVEKSFSFPSGHTMASVSLYGILIYLVSKSNLNKKIKVSLITFLILIPLLVALSRIYLGAHFATDVIGAMLLSSILLLLECHYIDKKGLL